MNISGIKVSRRQTTAMLASSLYRNHLTGKTRPSVKFYCSPLCESVKCANAGRPPRVAPHTPEDATRSVVRRYRLSKTCDLSSCASFVRVGDTQSILAFAEKWLKIVSPHLSLSLSLSLSLWPRPPKPGPRNIISHVTWGCRRLLGGKSAPKSSSQTPCEPHHGRRDKMSRGVAGKTARAAGSAIKAFSASGLNGYVTFGFITEYP